MICWNLNSGLISHFLRYMCGHSVSVLSQREQSVRLCALWVWMRDSSWSVLFDLMKKINKWKERQSCDSDYNTHDVQTYERFCHSIMQVVMLSWWHSLSTDAQMKRLLPLYCQPSVLWIEKWNVCKMYRTVGVFLRAVTSCFRKDMSPLADVQHNYIMCRKEPLR